MLAMLHRLAHYLLCLAVVFGAMTSIGSFILFISRQTLCYWNPDLSVFLRFLLDVGLLLLFIIQHSFMATGWFKRQLEQWLKISVSERILYVTTSSLCLLFVVMHWYSIPETYLWLIDTQRRSLLWLVFCMCHVIGWFLLGMELALMDLPEMLGLSQVYNYHNKKRPPLMEKAKQLREIYSRMRHPGALMLTILLWLHPLMTLDRVVLASVLTTYMIGRHEFEERHYKFAEKYFTVEYKTISKKSSKTYEYVEESS